MRLNVSASKYKSKMTYLSSRQGGVTQRLFSLKGVEFDDHTEDFHHVLYLLFQVNR